MTERFHVRSEDLQLLRVGPIGPHLEGFAALLSRQGYCRAIGWLKIRLAADLSRWLCRRRLALKDWDEAWTSAFLTARWKRLSRRPSNHDPFAAASAAGQRRSPSIAAHRGWRHRWDLPGL